MRIWESDEIKPLSDMNTAIARSIGNKAKTSDGNEEILIQQISLNRFRIWWVSISVNVCISVQEFNEEELKNHLSKRTVNIYESRWQTI